jgi:hypothetical protein
MLALLEPRTVVSARAWLDEDLRIEPRTEIRTCQYTRTDAYRRYAVYRLLQLASYYAVCVNKNENEKNMLGVRISISCTCFWN